MKEFKEIQLNSTNDQSFFNDAFSLVYNKLAYSAPSIMGSHDDLLQELIQIAKNNPNIIYEKFKFKSILNCAIELGEIFNEIVNLGDNNREERKKFINKYMDEREYFKLRLEYVKQLQKIGVLDIRDLSRREMYIHAFQNLNNGVAGVKNAASNLIRYENIMYQFYPSDSILMYTKVEKTISLDEEDIDLNIFEFLLAAYFMNIKHSNKLLDIFLNFPKIDELLLNNNNLKIFSKFFGINSLLQFEKDKTECKLFEKLCSGENIENLDAESRLNSIALIIGYGFRPNKDSNFFKLNDSQIYLIEKCLNKEYHNNKLYNNIKKQLFPQNNDNTVLR